MKWQSLNPGVTVVCMKAEIAQRKTGLTQNLPVARTCTCPIPHDTPQEGIKIAMDVVLYARIRMKAKGVSDWKARCMELVEEQAQIERAMSGYGSLPFERAGF